MRNNIWFVVACVLVFCVGYNINDVAISFPRYKVAVIDNQKAEIIKDIYNTFLSTRNVSKTQRTINQKYGIAKGRSFYQKVLRNTGYYGYKYEKENFYPPIIDKYTFDSVQSFMSNSYTRTNKRKY